MLAGLPMTRLMPLIVLFALPLFAAPAGAEVYPPTGDFAGMLISYSVSGATLGTAADTYDFTTSRRYSGGALQGPELRVSGTASQGSGYGANVTVRVVVGSQVQSTNFYLKYEFPNRVSKEFDLAVPIPPGAFVGGFSIDMVGSYNAGDRGLSVSCDFAEPAAGTVPPPVAAPPVGLDPKTCRLEYVRGTVEVIPTDGRTRYLGGTAKAPLRAGDRIETGPDSRAVLVFPDGTRFTVRSSTKLQLENDRVRLEVGGVTFNLQKQGAQFQVIAQTGCSGCLGTIFEVGTTEAAGTVIAVKQGEVWATDRAGAGRVVISAGQYSQVRKGRVPTAPRAMTARMAAVFFH